MRRGKISLIVVFMVLFCFIISGAGFGASKIKISFMNSKGEILTQLQEAAKVFNAENPGIEVEIISAPVGQSPFERLSALYASGNAPALSMLDGGDVPKLKAKYLDLSKEKWVKDVAAGLLADCTYDKKIMVFPATVEGYGFIYNKNVLDKAGVNPDKIKTLVEFKTACEKIKAIGVDPLVIGEMDWNLGAHFLTIAYSIQNKNSADNAKFLADLKAGKVNLIDNKGFNGLMDTFDVMKSYNANKNEPLSAIYEKCAEMLAKGQIGFWFMGTWVWPMLKVFDTTNDNFGYIAVPISNNITDYGNDALPIGVTKLIGIDKSQNSKKQQDAAKKFLNWLYFSKSGQEILVNKAGVLTAFKNVPTPKDPLNKSLKEFMDSGRVLQFIVLPADHWKQTGASMQKYLANVIDRKGLAKEIETYWKSQK